MGMPAPPWWCPLCLKIRYEEIKIAGRGPPTNTTQAIFGVMALLQDYQNRWGIGDYRIDSADADKAVADITSGDTCQCDPYECTINRRRADD